MTRATRSMMADLVTGMGIDDKSTPCC